MQTRLDRADRVRKEFVANASHELRTPLFSLSGFLELLDDEDIDDDTRAGSCADAGAGHRLTKLATDLLDLSRLDADAVQVEQEPIDLAVAARGLVREFRGLAVGHGSRISLVRPTGDVPHAVGDEQRVQQFGRALLDNAIRHNPIGIQVRVAVTAEDGVVRLDVSDDGPGIDCRGRRSPVRAVLPRRGHQRGRQRPRPGDRTRAGRADGRPAGAGVGEGDTRFALSLPAEQI